MENAYKQVDQTTRLDNAYQNAIKLFENRLINNIDKIVLLNPFNIMKKGYGIVYHGDTIISTVDKLNVNDRVTIKLVDGSVDATINKINK